MYVERLCCFVYEPDGVVACVSDMHWRILPLASSVCTNSWPVCLSHIFFIIACTSAAAFMMLSLRMRSATLYAAHEALEGQRFPNQSLVS